MKGLVPDVCILCPFLSFRSLLINHFQNSPVRINFPLLLLIWELLKTLNLKMGKAQDNAKIGNKIILTKIRLTDSGSYWIIILCQRTQVFYSTFQSCWIFSWYFHNPSAEAIRICLPLSLFQTLWAVRVRGLAEPQTWRLTHGKGRGGAGDLAHPALISFS